MFESRQRYGTNEVEAPSDNYFKVLLGLVKEPMILLLLISASIYFLVAKPVMVFFMIFAIALVAGISIYQESRNRNALVALQSLTQSTCKVLRDVSTVETLGPGTKARTYWHSYGSEGF